MTHLPELPKQPTPQSCVMQVVRVSGTIRKAEEEAIRRARAAILNARRENNSRSSDLLSTILGANHRGIPGNPVNFTGIEDREDEDEEDEVEEDGDDQDQDSLD